jgi:predicted amidohydrolase YtcJ
MSLADGKVLREAHAHVFQHGRSLGMVNLADCKSADDALEALAQRARGSSMVLAHGARPQAWETPRWPDIEQLDRISASDPVVAWCFDYHALVANRAALSAAGIDESTADPQGGIIERDESGRLTGVVYEQAALRVWESLPEPEAEERLSTATSGVADLVDRHGFVEIHDLKAQPWLGGVLARVAADLGGRVRFQIWPLLKDLPEVLASRSQWESELVSLGGAKIFVDGTLNSRTAWMLEPFADGHDAHPCGTPMMTPGQIEDAVRQCEAAGVPLAAHAIGDAAVRAVLDAIERVGPGTPGYRIEHCELIDKADVPRFAQLGVIASVQPCHLLYDIEAIHRGLPHRLDRVLPLRELIDSGLEPGRGLIFGSDVPIVKADPADSILAATARRGRSHRPEQAVGLDQRLTEAESWACFGVDAIATR